MRKLALGFVAAGVVVTLVSVALGAPGDRDRSFSADGVRTTDFLGHRDFGADLAIQDDDRAIVAGLTRLRGAENDFALARYRWDGRADRSFSSDGKLHTAQTGLGDESARAVAIQGNGRIVAAGHSGGDFALTRYRQDGRLDDSWAGDGKLRTDFGGRDDAVDVAIAYSGKIVAVGNTETDADYGVAVAVYSRRGSLIRKYTSDGDGSIDLSHASALVPLRDGGILVTADPDDPVTETFAVARFSAAGVLDAGFGDGGIATVDFPGRSPDRVSAMAFRDGRILLGGRSGSDSAFAAFGPGGEPDTNFSGDGRTTVDVRRFDYVADLALQDDGRVVAAGRAGTFAAITRLRPNGALDRSFGRNGHAFVRRPGVRREFAAVQLQRNGRIVAAGTAGPHFKQDFLIARFRG